MTGLTTTGKPETKAQPAASPCFLPGPFEPLHSITRRKSLWHRHRIWRSRTCQLSPVFPRIRISLCPAFLKMFCIQVFQASQRPGKISIIIHGLAVALFLFLVRPFLCKCFLFHGFRLIISPLLTEKCGIFTHKNGSTRAL
jgi:hypothetical protein